MRKIYFSLLISSLIFILSIPVWLKVTNYLHPIAVLVIGLGMNLAGLFIGSFLSKKTISIPNWTLHAMMAFYFLALLVLLFFRPNSQGDALNLIPFNTIQFYLTSNLPFIVSFYNLAANIALFIPFGIYYGYIAKRRTLMKLIGWSIVGILMIELTQFLIARGTLDIDDLILNLTGVIIGFWIFPYIQKTVVITGGEPSDLKR